MGQKISARSLRLPLTHAWTSKWFATKREYPLLIIEDAKIRETIMSNYGSNAGIAEIIISRNAQEVNLDIFTSKPGVLIGRGGKGITELNLLFKKLLKDKKIHVNVLEIKRPDLYASLVAASIGNQISRRIAYRRAIRQATERVMQAGAKGVRVIAAGRLNGAEIARTEVVTLGSMPFSTLKSDIDFSIVHAKTTYGIIGIKVWIHKGELADQVQEEPKSTRSLS